MFLVPGVTSLPWKAPGRTAGQGGGGGFPRRGGPTRNDRQKVLLPDQPLIEPLWTSAPVLRWTQSRRDPLACCKSSLSLLSALRLLPPTHQPSARTTQEIPHGLHRNGSLALTPLRPTVLAVYRHMTAHLSPPAGAGVWNVMVISFSP